MMPQHPTGLDRVVAQLSLIRLDHAGLADILNQTTRLARETVNGATDVSITVVEGSHAYTAASTSDLAFTWDEMQYQARLGPCLQAAAEQAVVVMHDAGAETRWSPWPARAAAAGAGSVVSVGLPVLDDVDGALNIYSRDPGAFGDDAIVAARAFAQHGAVTVANAHLYHRIASLAEQMQTAMEHRAVIEQAKGIIMGERRCGPDEAFAVLTRISQDTNRKVRHIAAALVARTQAQPGREPSAER